MVYFEAGRCVPTIKKRIPAQGRCGMTYLVQFDSISEGKREVTLEATDLVALLLELAEDPYFAEDIKEVYRLSGEGRDKIPRESIAWVERAYNTVMREAQRNFEL